MNGSWGHDTKGNKSKKTNYLTYMQNLKNKTNEQADQTHREQTADCQSEALGCEMGQNR